jgi:hypothetical protein
MRLSTGFYQQEYFFIFLHVHIANYCNQFSFTHTIFCSAFNENSASVYRISAVFVLAVIKIPLRTSTAVTFFSNTVIEWKMRTIYHFDIMSHNKAQTFFPNQAIITIINKVCATPVHRRWFNWCNGMQRPGILSKN